MKNRSDAISVRVSREAKAELQRIADAERRTLSQLVAIILDDFLKGHQAESKQHKE
jgi:predicted transcriptional regulator